MIKFKIEEGAAGPHYSTEDAVGLDVTAFSILKAYKGDTEVSTEKLEKMQQGFKDRGYIKLRAFERILFGTGISVEAMDKELEVQVRSRSGMTLKRGLSVLNSPGTIDPDYRGEIGVILYNSSPFLTTIERGERIAQLVPAAVVKTPIVLQRGHLAWQYDPVFDNDTVMVRGENGFGSTGTK